jgi:hypothetical protein
LDLDWLVCVDIFFMLLRMFVRFTFTRP